MDAEVSKAWFYLGNLGGGTVDGKQHSSRECFQKALAYDPNDAKSWSKLGTGRLNINTYTYKNKNLKNRKLKRKRKQKRNG